MYIETEFVNNYWEINQFNIKRPNTNVFNFIARLMTAVTLN